MIKKQADEFDLPNMPNDNKVRQELDFGLPEIPKFKPRPPKTVPSEEAAPRQVEHKPNVQPYLTPSRTAVSEMQNALINLSKTMSQNYLTSIDPQTHERGGSDPFGNFLVSQYVNNENVVGKQFVNVDLGEPNRSATSMANKSLRGVISTLGRVGSPGSEKGVDGIWQTRTNNALKQAAAVASSLLQLQKDMGIESKLYSQEDLAQLKNNIPESYAKLGDTAASRAKILTPNLNKLSKFYLEFEKNILNQPKYKQLITQEKAFTTHKKIEELDKEDQEFINTNIRQNVPGVNINGKPVALGDIATLESFKRFLSENNIPANNAQTFNKYFKLLQNLVETEGAGYVV